jgi:hypothetical protein
LSRRRDKKGFKVCRNQLGIKKKLYREEWKESEGSRK